MQKSEWSQQSNHFAKEREKVPYHIRVKRKKGGQRQGESIKHSLGDELEDQCLWNEESNCIFLLHLLKVSLYETNTASERQLYKKECLGVSDMNSWVTLASFIF